MDRSTAEGLAGGGALLFGASLLLPWYGLHADRSPGTLATGSGWETMGVVKWVVLALALLAGLRATHHVAAGAATALLVFVGVRFSNPPGAGDALADALPASGNGVSDALVRGMVSSIAESNGIELRPAWGMAAAAAGAAMALAGAVGRRRQ